jgi:hypothetical protein
MLNIWFVIYVVVNIAVYILYHVVHKLLMCRAPVKMKLA